jgi:hypothetical protein
MCTAAMNKLTSKANTRSRNGTLPDFRPFHPKLGPSLVGQGFLDIPDDPPFDSRSPGIDCGRVEVDMGAVGHKL